VEELNKNQIVLLTLLVSFITSIATGIVTVTLMDQAPAGVTQTVNRVVERTIERVVPGEPKQQVVIKEVPVQVTQEDLVQKVINDSIPSLVRINDKNHQGVGTGFVVSDDGLVLTAATVLADLRVNTKYEVQFQSGDRVNGRLIRLSSAGGIVVLKLDPDQLSAFKARLLAASTVASSTISVKTWQFLPVTATDLTLGQTVVGLGSPDAGPPNVALGIISAVDSASSTPVKIIRTAAANPLNIGGPILNIKGRVIGLSQGPGTAAAASSLVDLINPANQSSL
jgi:S1-C subfamily serine protease